MMMCEWIKKIDERWDFEKNCKLTYLSRNKNNGKIPDYNTDNIAHPATPTINPIIFSDEVKLEPLDDDTEEFLPRCLVESFNSII